MSHFRALARRLLFTVLTILVAAGLGGAVAAPRITSTDSPERGTVSLDRPTVSIPTGDPFGFSVEVELPASATYLEARLRLYREDGRLVYQKTEVRHDVPTSTVTFTFERDTEDLDMPADSYPIDVRVGIELAEGSQVIEHVIEDRLLVHDPDTEATPLAVVARVSCAPGLDPEGRFVIDPVLASASRDAADQLARYVLDNPTARLALAIAPHTLKEWDVAAGGYEVVGPDGIRTVGPDYLDALAFADTLTTIRDAVATGRLELLEVPYADPDLTGLSSVGLLDELAHHLEAGRSAYAETLDATPSAGVITLGESVSPGVLDVLASSDVEYVLVGQSKLASIEETPAPGVYSTSVSDVEALVIDEELSNLISEGSDSAALQHLYGLNRSDDASGPVVTVIELGPGHEAQADSLIATMDTLRLAPWLAPSTCGESAAMTPAGRIELPELPITGTAAPDDYWPDVAANTRAARALERAVGTTDPDAQAATEAAMLSQSRCWAGPDEGWALADRGRAHSAAANRIASAILGAVSLSAPDVTLSSSSGRIPISIVNASDKALLLTLDLTSSGLALGDSRSLQVTVLPSENFLTVPVDLQSSLSGRLGLTLRSGEFELIEHSVVVRASYLDRLAVIAGVVILLGTLLAFIRRRAISSESPSNDDAERSS